MSVHCTLHIHPPPNSSHLPHPTSTPLTHKDGTSVWVDRLAKVDVNTGAVEIWQQPNCYPGEPLFVATPGGAEEDDGVLLSVVLDGRGVLGWVGVCTCLAVMAPLCLWFVVVNIIVNIMVVNIMFNIVVNIMFNIVVNIMFNIVVNIMFNIVVNIMATVCIPTPPP